MRTPSLPPGLRRPLALALLAGLAAAGLSSLLPDQFRAEVRILPDAGHAGPQNHAGIWAPTAPPVGPGTREDGPTVIYDDILRSRRVADAVLSATYAYRDRPWRFGALRDRRGTLLEYLGAGDPDRAMGAFRGLLRVERNPKSGLLTLTAETRSPELSLQVVRRATEELRRALVDLAQAEGRNRARTARERLEEVGVICSGKDEAFRRFQDANRNWETSAAPDLRFQGERLRGQVALWRRVQENLTLNQEQALLEARNDAQTLLVLDAGDLPRAKSRPHRSFIVFGAMVVTGTATWAALNRTKVHDLFIAKEKP
ncbi:hypothetical protein [Mesoterricola silvestris]|nr:hypothetical protein [Mesoterricola silvestris]